MEPLFDPPNFSADIKVVSVKIWHKKKLLLLLRVPDASGNAYWAPPAGKVEDSETLKEAAFREIHEETGLVLSDVSKTGQFKLRYPSRDVLYTCFETSCDSVSSISLDSREHTDFQWVTLKQAISLDDLIPGERRCLHEYDKQH